MVNQPMTKEAKIHNGEKTVSSINGAGKTEQPYAKEWNRTTILHHTQKSTQNGLTDLNIKPEAIELLKDNIKGKLLDISVLTMIFWIWHLSKGNKNKINKWDYINLKMSAQQRKPSTIWKTNLLYVPTYMWNLKNKTNEYNKT